jgi:hypothetical protein
MASITTRSGKGSALTHAEVDANFTNLNTDTSNLDSNKLSVYTITTTSTSKTLANRERCTVTASGLTITLPASPAAGWEVTITVAGTFVNTVVARNSANIMGLAENMTLDVANDSTTLLYVNATQGWIILS